MSHRVKRRRRNPNDPVTDAARWSELEHEGGEMSADQWSQKNYPLFREFFTNELLQAFDDLGGEGVRASVQKLRTELVRVSGKRGHALSEGRLARVVKEGLEDLQRRGYAAREFGTDTWRLTTLGSEAALAARVVPAQRAAEDTSFNFGANELAEQFNAHLAKRGRSERPASSRCGRPGSPVKVQPHAAKRKGCRSCVRVHRLPEHRSHAVGARTSCEEPVLVNPGERKRASALAHAALRAGRVAPWGGAIVWEGEVTGNGRGFISVGKRVRAIVALDPRRTKRDPSGWSDPSGPTVYVAVTGARGSGFAPVLPAHVEGLPGSVTLHINPGRLDDEVRALERAARLGDGLAAQRLAIMRGRLAGGSTPAAVAPSGPEKIAPKPGDLWVTHDTKGTVRVWRVGPDKKMKNIAVSSTLRGHRALTSFEPGAVGHAAPDFTVARLFGKGRERDAAMLAHKHLAAFLAPDSLVHFATGYGHHFSVVPLTTAPGDDVPMTKAKREKAARAEGSASDVAAKIRAALRRRSGKDWSVSRGRGTAGGWLTITSPPSRQVNGHMSEADQAELGRLLGDSRRVHHQGVSIPSGGDYRQEYLARAEGRTPEVYGVPYWD